MGQTANKEIRPCFRLSLTRGRLQQWKELSVTVVAYEKSEGCIWRSDCKQSTALIYITISLLIAKCTCKCTVYWEKYSVSTDLCISRPCPELFTFRDKKKMVSLLNCSFSSLFKIYMYATLIPSNGVDLLLSRPGWQLLPTV